MYAPIRPRLTRASSCFGLGGGRGTTLLFVRRHLAALFERELTGRLLVITDHGMRLR
jgi:hypothetical protein